MSEANTAMTDEQMMLLMVHADGELDGDELAQVEALLRDNADAKGWIDGFAMSKRALHDDAMTAATAGPDLADVTTATAQQTEAVQLMAFVDGELSEEQQRVGDIAGLLASSVAAKTWVNDLQVAKQALHDDVMQPNMEADLSMVRGRVMRKLPAEPRAAVQEAPTGFFPAIAAWLSELGLGKTALAAGALAAVLLLAIGVGQIGGPNAGGQVGDGPGMSNIDSQANGHAQPSDGEPEVIIEDMESDGGTVIFEGGDKPGEAVIIWHIDPSEEGAG